MIELTVDFKTLAECDSKSLTAFVNLVDNVFLHSKSRSGSMLQRYPGLFLAENFGNLHTAWCGDKLAGAIAVRKFGMKIDGNVMNGAMVGTVCVNPDFRGLGIGSKLVEQVTEKILSAELDFSVLWTMAPNFYARHGWMPSDRGVIGELCNSTISNVAISDDGLQTFWELIDRIRIRWESQYVARTLHDYRATPGSVENVYAIIEGVEGTNDAYAIVGAQGATGVVYEMVGNPNLFHSLWEKIDSKFENIIVNDSLGSASHRWLCQNSRLKWKRQNQAMWIGYPQDASVPLSQLHVPYFDRI